ncbi:Elongation factor Ts, mitochondrial [Savitreella phatthalungensis]
MLSRHCCSSGLTRSLYRCYSSTSTSGSSSLQLIKRLRDESGAPLNLIKNAVSKSSGDYAAALAALKEEMAKRGDKLVAKSAGREAREGWVIASRINTPTNRPAASISQLNTETDFVARSEAIVSLARVVGGAAARTAREHGTADFANILDPTLAATAASPSASTPLHQAITHQMSLVGETVRLSAVLGTALAAHKVTQTGVQLALGVHCHGGPPGFNSTPGVMGDVQVDTAIGRMGALVQVSVTEELAGRLNEQGRTVVEFADEIAREVVAQQPESAQEFWTLDKVGDQQSRTVRQWAGEGVELVNYIRLDRS